MHLERKKDYYKAGMVVGKRRPAGENSSQDRAEIMWLFQLEERGHFQNTKMHHL